MTANTQHVFLQDYVRSIPTLSAILGDGSLVIEEIGDGNINFIYTVKNQNHPQKAIVIKYAEPYLRCIGESFPLSLDRIDYEIKSLQQFCATVPQHVPRIYHADAKTGLFAMQYLGEHIIMRKGLTQNIIYPHVADHLATFMAHNLFKTSALFLDSTAKRELQSQFSKNHALCLLTENFVFTFAFMQHETNPKNPALHLYAEKLIHDATFKNIILDLKYAFMTQTDALLHGDLHTGSVMLNEKETYIIDSEFAFYGPFGFDIGAMIANIITAWVSHIVQQEKSDASYGDWVLALVKNIWQQFEHKFLTLWRAHQGNSNALLLPEFLTHQETDIYRGHFMQKMFHQSLGYAGCKILRRMLGIAGVQEIRGISDDSLRYKAEILCLDIGSFLVKNHARIQTIDELVTLLKSCEK